MNSLYPGPDITQRCIKEKSVDDRHKKEDCRIPSCRYYLVKMARLERHVVKTHKMTFKKYRQIFCDQDISKNDRFFL